MTRWSLCPPGVTCTRTSYITSEAGCISVFVRHPHHRVIQLPECQPPSWRDCASAKPFSSPKPRGGSRFQQRKPQTLGYALNYSPVGLAAWILHNFRTLCDCDGDVEKKFTKDELLSNITIDWATESITSAMRLYRESRLANRAVGLNVGTAGSPAGVRGRRVEVPTGCALFRCRQGTVGLLAEWKKTS